jgi:hypothetical protein
MMINFPLSGKVTLLSGAFSQRVAGGAGSLEPGAMVIITVVECVGLDWIDVLLRRLGWRWRWETMKAGRWADI